MSKTANRMISLLLALVMALSCVTFVAADAKTADQVAAEIEAMSADANDYTAADKAAVEALKADYDALSADDQAALDSRTTHTGTGQPLGRVLESALWTVWSFDEADNSTTLPDGTYNSTSTPALTSQYSKGKSTSSRQKAWSVKQVEVTDGKAYATIAVESSSYTAIMLHGKTYPKTSTTGNSEFANVPIDLNSTFYFNGVSSSMPVPIAFSLTTTIEEPAAEQPPEPPAVETFGFTLQVGQYTEGADFHTASFEDVTYSLTDQNNKTWQPSNATTGMLTYSNLPADGTYTFTAAKEDWAVVTQGEWDVAAHAYTYTFTGADAISVTITSADAGKNVTEATHPGMILRKKPREVNAVDEALAAVPADLTLFTSATAAAVETAVAAADPEEKDEAKLSAMAAAVNGAVAALRPVDGSYTAVATHTGKGMFKIIDVLRLEVEGGEMTLHAVNGSKTYTKLYLGTTDEAKAADASAHILPVEEATASNNKAGYHWAIPVSALNTEIPVAAYSKSKSTFNSTGNFLVEAASLKRIAPPTVDLTITNNTGMFQAVTAQLETEGGNTTLVMSLSGTGYHDLFKGTYEQAVANGNVTDNWIHGATNTDGKWEFRIPLAEGETYVPVVAISNSYYTKYLNGQNSLARAFYPRQFTIDYEAKTIVTGDYAYSQTLTVTNSLTKFKVNAAALHTVGGPNSNNYAATLTLTMGSTSFDKAFVGRASAITDTTETIALGEGNTFVLPVKWVKEFGNPDTLESLLGGSFVVSFHSVKNDAWYERQFTVSEADGTLTIDKVPAERTDLTITNNTGMFKALTAQLETEGGKTTLVMSLSGSGYHELFKGTYEQAVANGAATDNWIHGATNTDGKWEFRIPLAEGETYVPVVAISNSYYTKYLNGQNSLARAFYPRQFTIDYEAKTIVTDDYKYTQTLTVTNSLTKFKVNAAALNTVGGPNSNNYAATLTLTMGSTAYDKAFVGRASAITDTTETIALGEGNTFALPVKWVKEFGNPDTLESLLGDSFVVSFHSASKDAWYERQFTVSDADGKLTIDEVPSEAVTVEPGTRTLEKGVCYRFGEGTFTLSGDPTVYRGGQEFYVSATGTYTVTKGR